MDSSWELACPWTLSERGFKRHLIPQGRPQDVSSYETEEFRNGVLPQAQVIASLAPVLDSPLTLRRTALEVPIIPLATGDPQALCGVIGDCGSALALGLLPGGNWD